MSGLFEEDDDVEESPKGNQPTIINSDQYPLRVLAGAGTGKTFTMVRKVERLLENDIVAPRRVLALTFTNQAADSMRSKLNARIGADGFDIDAYTYHSISHSILQEYPYHAGIDSNFDIATDADKYELAREALEAVPAQFVNPDGGYYGPHENLLDFISSMKQDSIQPDALQAYLPDAAVLIDLAEMTDRLESAAREHLRRQSLGADGPAGFVDDIQTFVKEVELEQAALGESPLEQDVAGYLEALIDSCEQMATRVQADHEEIETGELSSAVRIPAVLFSGYGTEGEQMGGWEYPTGIPGLQFNLVDRLRSYISNCQQAHDFVHGYQEYERLRQQNDILDFDDLIRHAVTLLRDETLGEEIAGQWDYIFCDEFQDTDALQFELVTALADHNRVFVVGDDDQAIYEWRGAESDNIGEKLDTAYPALTDEQLELNFRSKQPILDLANNAIEQLPDRESDKQLRAFGDKEDATDGVAVVDTTPPDGSDLDEADHEAEQITTTIAGLLRGDFDPVDVTYDLGDIAILVRKKRHARPILDSFEEAGIPFELVGDLATESVGVETVLSYLRSLAVPEDDVSTRRVLLMRYRLSEDDLRQLAQESDSLSKAVREADPADYDEPDRIEAAQADFEHLMARRRSLPVRQLYHEMLTTTDIEWFLTTQQQRELRGLEELISDYGDRSSQPSIGPAFLEYLDDHDSIIETTDSEPTEQAEAASDAVTIMTVHKAKGLDFPVVMMPQLTASEWGPRSRNYSYLKTRLDGTPFWRSDPVQRDENEQRRLLHVGITRAEEQLVLFGQSDDGGSGETLSPEYIQQWIADDIEWDLTGGEFPVWELIQSNLPPTAEDWTAHIANHSVRDTGAVATHGDGALDYEAAVTTALELADAMLADSLTDGDPEAVGINTDAFGAAAGPSIKRRHSYTSLGTLDECARQHYLDHVVYAYDAPPSAGTVNGANSGQAGDTEVSDGREKVQSSGSSPAPDQASSNAQVSNREIGILFHETAEAATEQGLQTRDQWAETCRRLGTQLDLQAAVDPALSCVDRFFETSVSDWPRLSAERSFTIDIESYTVTGEIDLIARNPDGELVVIDYKATSQTKSETNRQLPLYLLACEEILDEPVSRAGYVYVSEIGPDVDIRTYDTSALNEARDAILDSLKTAAQTDYMNYTAGEHCLHCPHNDLPCSHY